MKIKIFVLSAITSIVFIQCSSQLAIADKKANEYQNLYSDKKFDTSLAKKQLEKGTSSVRGILYKKTNKLALVGGKQYGTGVKVTLFPVNDYFMSWYELRDKKENKKTNVYMSNEAYSYRLETTTDDFGRFEFKEMKPGKYFLQAFFTTTDYYNKDVVVGTNSYGTKYYQNQRYSENKNHRNEKFIEIIKNNEIIEVDLK